MVLSILKWFAKYYSENLLSLTEPFVIHQNQILVEESIIILNFDGGTLVKINAFHLRLHKI